MALTDFTKIGIYGWEPLKEDILREIQRFGVIEFIEEPEAEAVPAAPGPDEAQKLQMAESCFRILGIFSKKNLLESFLPAKLDIDPKEYLQAVEEFPLDEFHKKCREREERLKALEGLKEKLKADYDKYSLWASLEAPMSEFKGTETTAVHLIRIGKKFLPEFEEEISGYGFIDAVRQTKNASFCAAGCLRSREDSFFAALGKLGGEVIPLDPGDNYPGLTPLQAMMEVKKSVDKTYKEEAELYAAKAKDAAHLRKIMILCDHYRNIDNRNRLAGRMSSTGKVFSCKGWMPEKQLAKLEKILEEKFPESFIEKIPAGAGENPPVELANSPSVEPFETITGLYGMPGRGELDPTPFLAPFFALFFAVCMTDAGYGAVVLLLSVLLAKKIKLGVQALKFVKLLGITGIMTIIVGALTGGFFGIQPEQVPDNLAFMLDIRRGIMLFDPMEQFLLFMLISLGLGFLQVWFGYIVKLLQEIKAGRTAEGVMTQLPWIVILPGFLLLGITRSPETVLLGVVEESPLGSGWEKAATAMVYAGIAGMFIQPGAGGILKKIGGGVYSLYGLIGCLGDILSYVRLFALGLATVAMAIAINTMAEMAGEIPVIGFFAALVIAAAGHLGNVAINALSAFIHTVRLQFVEFFTKFYQGGGRSFRPFSYETEFIEKNNVETT